MVGLGRPTGAGEVVSVRLTSTCQRNNVTIFNMAESHSMDITDSDTDDSFAREADNLGVNLTFLSLWVILILPTKIRLVWKVSGGRLFSF